MRKIIVFLIVVFSFFVLSPNSFAGPGFLEGTITDSEGVGVGGVKIVVIGGPASTIFKKTETEMPKSEEEQASGKYNIKLPAGTYKFKIKGDAIREQIIDNIEITQNRTTTLDVTVEVINTSSGAGWIEGTVYDGKKNKIEGATVEIIDSPKEYKEKIEKLSEEERPKPVVTGADGIFVLGDLDSGQYEIKVISPTGEEEIKKISVRKGKKKETQFYIK